MNELLMIELKEGENINWQGAPAPYKLLDAEIKRFTLTIWIIAIAVAAVLSVLYTIYAFTGDRSNFQPFVYALTIGFPLLLFIDPIRDRKHINTQLLVVTDQRVMIFHKNTVSENKAVAVNLKSVDAVEIEEIEPGYSRVLIGSKAFGLKPYTKLKRAITGITDDKDKPVALVFYRLANYDCDKISSIFQDNAVPVNKSQQ